MVKINELYDMMLGEKPAYTKDTEWENFDEELSEEISAHDVPIVKSNLVKLENMNILEADFKILAKVPKSWKMIMGTFAKYYAIIPRLV